MSCIWTVLVVGSFLDCDSPEPDETIFGTSAKPSLGALSTLSFTLFVSRSKDPLDIIQSSDEYGSTHRSVSFFGLTIKQCSKENPYPCTPKAAAASSRLGIPMLVPLQVCFSPHADCSSFPISVGHQIESCQRPSEVGGHFVPFWCHPFQRAILHTARLLEYLCCPFLCLVSPT